MRKLFVTLFQLLPVIISALLAAAHFLRSGTHVLFAISLLTPFVLLIRRPLSVRIVQAALVLATLEWIRTVFVLASVRARAGTSSTRLVIILAAVACFTLASALVFYSKTLRERYRFVTPS